ncbi:hypothetical protein ACFQPA_05410 [Halomarina halobia]|uniref:Uncharacterized protein n=1 Tax=Halomarina halobia TaxID=3033386 RepID=A0ABD6A653_9EURY|nr:hypothetical protein [Halomarina sp. PSR21]
MAAPAPSPESVERYVTAHCTSPERTVFTESKNPDGWIATDLVVDVDR